jgi:hypothetical protein
MHGTTSSAPGRADGRGSTFIAANARTDARPFHCVPLLMREIRKHRWRLVRRDQPVIYIGHRGGWFLFEYCTRRGCAAQRLTPANPPGVSPSSY